MNTVFLMLTIQVLMGGFDNLWHHELQAKLPQRCSARHELALHAAREAIYAVVFIGLAWFEWRGALAAVLAALLLTELVITLADFLEEDRTRQLPPLERILHTLLTISYGLFLGVFAPVWLHWLAQSTALAWVGYGWLSWLCTGYGIGVLAFSVRNALAVWHLRQLAATAAAAPLTPPQAGTSWVAPAVLVTGASGFIGSALVANFRRDGYRVIVLSRDVRQARASLDPGVWVVDRLSDIPGETRIDTVVNLAGARVLGLPWTAARRRTLLASRVQVTTQVVALMRRLQQPPRLLLSASAVGYYGSTRHASPRPLSEAAAPCPGQFQSDLCIAIEHEALRAQALGVRVLRLRLGVVLGRNDGAYPMLALAARLGLGAILGGGDQAAPWVHLDDAVGSIRFLMAHASMRGPVNIVAPTTPTQAEFARALGASFGRPVWLRVPYAPLRALLGEMASILLEGQNVQPTALVAAGYRFAHPELSQALADLAQPQRTVLTVPAAAPNHAAPGSS